MLDAKTLDAMPLDEHFHTLEGTAYYASVHFPKYSAHEKFGSPPTFEVKLGLEKDQLSRAKDLGLKILEPTDTIPLPHIELKRKVKDIDDPMASKPQVVDSMQNPVPEEILIGNGSRVLCKFFIYGHPNMKAHGTGKTLMKVQILKLIPYAGKRKRDGDDQLVKDAEGFVIPKTATSSKNQSVEDEIPFDTDDGMLSDPFNK